MARRVLIDECLPHALRQYLSGHDAMTAVYAGFAGLKNGALLNAAKDAGFLKNHLPKISDAIDAAVAGTVTRVDVGLFARPKRPPGLALG